MGKVSSKDSHLKKSRQKRRSRTSSNKYLKPGALAQLRYGKGTATRPCTDLGKKRIAVSDVEKVEENPVIEEDIELNRTPLMLSPVSLGKESNIPLESVVLDVDNTMDHVVIEGTPAGISQVFSSPIKYARQNSLVRTPKTPRVEDCDSESRLEALPMDLLVNVLCHLHHDQLRAVFHVSQRIRKAVQIARQFHFNYTTPDRSRQEMLRMLTPRPTDHWPFRTRGEGKGTPLRSPLAPKAPRQGPRPPSRIKIAEMRQIAAVLFQEKSSFPSQCIVPSVLPKPLCKSLASNRALFYEDELCQAVAQNKLR